MKGHYDFLVIKKQSIYDNTSTYESNGFNSGAIFANVIELSSTVVVASG